MREGSRETVDPHDDQRVALADPLQHPRQHRPGAAPARGLLHIDLGAARAFQGLRIHVNNELGDLEAGLEAALEALEVGGRLVVISFHSLEDRIVKLFMRRLVKGESDNLPRNLPVRFEAFVPKIKIHGKAQFASEAELKANPRSRSAVMRVAEKLR